MSTYFEEGYVGKMICVAIVIGFLIAKYMM